MLPQCRLAGSVAGWHQRELWCDLLAQRQDEVFPFRVVMTAAGSAVPPRPTTAPAVEHVAGGRGAERGCH